MKKIFTPLILMIFWSCSQKITIDKEALAKELEEIYKLDQKYREEMFSVHEEFGFNSPQFHDLIRKQEAIDFSNLKRVVEIIEQVGGYPGKSLVGQSASEAAFFVLQHAPDSVQEKYYNLIIEAAKTNELDKRLAAMYQDRVLMHRGEPQIFGTQIRTELITDAKTGAKRDTTFVWPIADTTKIDSVRMWNGMGSLEGYLNSYGLSRWR